MTDSSDAGPILDALIDRASAARANAYAPYSGFAVGAAVSTDQGVFSGANVENAAFPVGTCAERVAAGAAVAAGARLVHALAVAGPTEEPTPPCGMCRQFLFEFGPDMTVVSVGTGGRRRRWPLSELLPAAFDPAALGER